MGDAVVPGKGARRGRASCGYLVAEPFWSRASQVSCALGVPGRTSIMRKSAASISDVCYHLSSGFWSSPGCGAFSRCTLTPCVLPTRMQLGSALRDLLEVGDAAAARALQYGSLSAFRRRVAAAYGDTAGVMAAHLACLPRLGEIRAERARRAEEERRASEERRRQQYELWQREAEARRGRVSAIGRGTYVWWMGGRCLWYENLGRGRCVWTMVGLAVGKELGGRGCPRARCGDVARTGFAPADPRAVRQPLPFPPFSSSSAAPGGGQRAADVCVWPDGVGGLQPAAVRRLLQEGRQGRALPQARLRAAEVAGERALCAIIQGQGQVGVVPSCAAYSLTPTFSVATSGKIQGRAWCAWACMRLWVALRAGVDRHPQKPCGRASAAQLGSAVGCRLVSTGNVGELQWRQCATVRCTRLVRSRCGAAIGPLCWTSQIKYVVIGYDLDKFRNKTTYANDSQTHTPNYYVTQKPGYRTVLQPDTRTALADGLSQAPTPAERRKQGSTGRILFLG